MTPLTMSSINSENIDAFSFSLLSFTPETIQTIELSQIQSPAIVSPQSTLPSTLPPIQPTPAVQRRSSKVPEAPCKFPAVKIHFCRNWMECDGMAHLDGLCVSCYDTEHGIRRKLFEN